MGSANSNHDLATPSALSAALSSPNHLIVDLRDEGERYHRLAGAVSAVWDREKKEMPLSSLPQDKETVLIVHCASGNRVKEAIPFLQAAGYKNCINGGGPGRYPMPDGAPPAPPPPLWETYGDRRIIFQQSFDELGSSTYTYLFGCPSTGEALIVDPVVEHVERDLAAVAQAGLKLKLALNTHCHADHITGTGEMKKRLPDLKSAISAESGAKADIHFKDGDEFTFGAHKLLILGTPGHTNGCSSFHVPAAGLVCTGDALFIGGCGRTDFQQGSSEGLYDSVHNKLFTLPNETVVYPGHDYQGRFYSTIGGEKENNPRLGMKKTKAEFVDIMAKLELAYPKQIDRALPANLMCGFPE
uniref:persulfide dioxygenase n=1 Tax=Strombidinopsis acuminata TaxID=141414 RepID=A0A7S3TAK8_9SPIT